MSRCLPLGALLLSLMPVNPLANEPDAATDQTPVSLDALMEDIDRLRREHRVPSVALTLVSGNGTIWSGATGYADLETRKPATADTLYRIGSITKAFTSLAVLLAVEQGQLSLDDTLDELAPDAPLNNRWAEEHPVQIAHLLEHSAGLLDITKAEFDHNDPGPSTLEQGLAVGAEARVCLWPPGLHASYSNAGAGLAAYALEQVTRQRYETFVEERLFVPLGMNNAGFYLDRATQEKLATGYDADGKSVIPYWHMVLRPFGAINATPRDMASLVQLLLTRGTLNGKTLLSPSSIERMETPRTTLAAQSGLEYGYGLGNYQFVYRGFLFHGHGGDGDGYLSHYAYSRDLGLGYFVVINAFNSRALRVIRQRIQDFLIQDRKGPAPPPVASIGPKQLLALTGRYQAETWRFPWDHGNTPPGNDRLDVILQDGRLYTIGAGRDQRELLPVNRHHFRRTHEPVATIAFVEHDGELYLQGDFGNYRRIAVSAQGSGD
ncbi:serine hydrolase domain-containing protein [Thiogranum longum]